jgi:hypothetical protein
MIRELTKSALSFSWALSMLGIKQAMSLGRPGQQQVTGDLFAPLTDAAVGQLDESMKNIYSSGSKLQSRLIDMAFLPISPANWTPGRPEGKESQTTTGPAAPTRQATGGLDAAVFWMNPLTWFDPRNWDTMRSMAGCGRPSGGCSSQPSGQPSGGAAGGGSPTGWGPMPG